MSVKAVPAMSGWPSNKPEDQATHRSHKGPENGVGGVLRSRSLVPDLTWALWVVLRYTLTAYVFCQMSMVSLKTTWPSVLYREPTSDMSMCTSLVLYPLSSLGLSASLSSCVYSLPHFLESEIGLCYILACLISVTQRQLSLLASRASWLPF